MEKQNIEIFEERGKKPGKGVMKRLINCYGAYNRCITRLQRKSEAELRNEKVMMK